MSRTKISFIVAFLLAGCAAQNPAPIVERSLSGTGQPLSNVIQSAPSPSANTVQPGSYVVKKGDTLYRIALENGIAYGDLANWNGLNDANDIKVDQVLRLTAPDQPTGVEVSPLRDAPAAVAVPYAPAAAAADALAYPKVLKFPYGSQAAETIGKQAEGPVGLAAGAMPSKPPAVSLPSPTNGSSVVSESRNIVKSAAGQQNTTASDDESLADWLPPTAGKLLRSFTEESKGVDFSGKMGQPVLAAQSGKVVYAGTGLRGYGKMIIVKHNNAYLSAYAHNSKLLVKEGDEVKRGEKIAEMGNTDTDQVKLHFEIRKFGKPVDPTKFITADKT